MSVKDGEKYLRVAIDSIMVQTFSDFEFIIIDDGSQDGTAKILEGYSDRRIVTIRNPTNIGLTKSLNLGLEMARGEYIARMDADDISLPHRLSSQVSFLETNSDVGVVGTAAYLIDGESKISQLVSYPENHYLLHWIMCFFENPIIHPSVMFRTQLVRSFGGYNEAYMTSEDYELWGRVVGSTKLANIQKVCLHLRKHGENISRLKNHQQQLSSLEISTSIISNLLESAVKSAQLQSYCDYLWNRTIMSQHEAIFIIGIIRQLTNIFLGNPQIINSEKLWIVNDITKKVNDISEEVNMPLITRIKNHRWKRSLKHYINEID